MKRALFAIILIVFGLSAIFFLQNKPKPNGPTVTIRNHTFTVEIADDTGEQRKGLSHRMSLDETHGMLFIFEQPGLHTFWMKDTLIPLDMIFIKDDRIVTIHRDVKPEPTISDNNLQRYPPTEPVNYVLEINGGLSDKYGFQKGDTVNIEH